MMKDHIYKEGKTKTDENTYYIAYPYLMYSISKVHGMNCDPEKEYYKDGNFIKVLNNTIEMHINYPFLANHPIYNHIPYKKGPSGKITNEYNPYCIYGTKDELENWKYFVFNNKLPLFINIVLTIDQHNNSLNYMPWLTDKHYTDGEINSIFKFTKDEIKLIDTVISKFERNSEWFKRYMIGNNF